MIFIRIKVKNFLLIVAILALVGCDDKSDKDTNQNNFQTPTIKITNQEQNLSNDKTAKFTSYDIKGNRVIDIAPNGESNTTTRQITAVAMIRNPYESININLLEKRLSHNFIVKCSACHNDYANGIIGPSLLSKSENEIKDMIVAYREKTKKNVLMRELVANMSDSEIETLAKEISEFNAQVRKSSKKDKK